MRQMFSGWQDQWEAGDVQDVSTLRSAIPTFTGAFAVSSIWQQEDAT